MGPKLHKYIKVKLHLSPKKIEREERITRERDNKRTRRKGKRV